MIACTVIARNYLAQARVLTRSFLDHHPDGSVRVLVLDDPEHEIGSGEDFRVLSPSDVLPPDEFARMATAYGIVELATAVKPALLRHLLSEAPVVAYFDPDIQIFAPLNDVFDAAAEHGIALTPHSTSPLPREGDGTSTEDVILDAGVFNLGFIAMGQCTEAVDWWDSRLRRECIIDPAHGRFVDQRWVDLFPAYFTPAILRDPGLNVAWWNAPNRAVISGPDGPLVNGSPLRFFHFSGYDPDRPWLLSTHQGPIPRVLLSDRPDLRALTDAYRQRVIDAGYTDWRPREYGLALAPDGLLLDERMRRLYRDALRASERNEVAEPPNPFTHGDDAFVAWLGTSDSPGAGPWPLGRYIHDVWEQSPELRARFADPHRDDAEAIRQWAGKEGVQDGMLPPSLARHLTPIVGPAEPPVFTPGLHIVAPFGDGSDRDIIASRIARVAEAAGIAVSTTTLPPRGRAAVSDFAIDWSQLEMHEVNIFITESDRLPEAIHMMPPALVTAPRNYAVIRDDVGPYIPVPDACSLFLDALWACSTIRARELSAAHPNTSVEVIPLPPARLATDRGGAALSTLVIGDSLAVLRDAGVLPSGPLVIAIDDVGHSTEDEERLRMAASGSPAVDIRRVRPTDMPALLAEAAAIVVGGIPHDLLIPVLDAQAAGVPIINAPAPQDAGSCLAFLTAILKEAAVHSASADPEPPRRQRWRLPLR